jgi:hypothetical protein
MAQRVGGGPEIGFEAEVGAGIVVLGVRLCHGVPYLVMQRIGGWCRRQTLELWDDALSAVSSSGWLHFHGYSSMTMLPSGLNFHWSD